MGGIRRSLLVSLQISILTLFLVISFALVTLLAWYNYVENSQAALESGEQFLAEISEKVYERVTSSYERVYTLAGTIHELPDMSEKPGMLMHPISWNAMRTLKSNPSIHSVFLGFADGDFFQIVSYWDNRQAKRDSYGGPEETRFAVRRIFRREDGLRVEIIKYLDENKQIVGSAARQEPQYDPTKRPWYNLAEDRAGQVRTKLYIFSFLKAPGFTVAQRFDGPVAGVLGVDITLDSLCRFLALQNVSENGQVFIFNSKGQIVAHPDRTKVIKHEHLGPGSSAVVPVEIIDLHDPVLSRMLEEFDAGKALSGEIETEQKGYLWRVTPMEREYAADEYVAVTAPVRDFTEPIARTRVKSLMFTAVAFLLAVPVIAYASHRISKPLKRLVGEAEAIRRLELDEPIDVTSHITEINDLAKAMAAMKTAVQTFGRYVPKTLVKRVIGAQVLPILGGERRELTIMFTDVADFTTLSENISAEELMLQVSQYFREMGGVITENHGTIDKYIGDAIMAFWNAPDEDDKHAEHACAAALMARRASGRLNEAWRGRGKPAMITRFGLHAADVVVGNVGSHDRMNYTAIGRAVNTASRLEGLNKHYGTRVLVSGAVAGRVRGRFLLRPVDMVIPKGSADPVQVFELLGAKPDNDRVPPEIKSNREDIRFCSIWDEAYDLYTSRRFAEARERFAELLELRPGDGPAKVFEARSAAYAADPPGDDWTGVEEFKVK